MIIFLRQREDRAKGYMMSVHDPAAQRSLGELNHFRQEFYRCLTRWADGLFELADAVLYTDGPVRTLVG